MSSGHIRRRGTRSWELKFDVGNDPVTGRRVTKTRSFKGTRRDAEAELRKLLTSVDHGTYADAGKLTLGAWLDGWLEDRRHSISPKTHERYGELIAQHLKPCLGAIPLSKVTTLRLNEFYTDRLTRGRLDGKGGLSPQTVRHLDRLLHRAFHDAIKARLAAHNPVDYVERPKVERKPHRVLDHDELHAVLAKAAGGRLHAPLFIILATGVRRGELLALRWRNLDLEAAQMEVTQTVEETRAGVRLKDVKSAAGRRRVDLPLSAIGVLRAHQLEQKKEHLALGLGWSVDTLVFPAIMSGDLWRPKDFTKAIINVARAAGVRGFSPHKGRHDHFTRLLKAGIHPKVAQIRAGHSSVAVTMDVYSHATEGLQKEAAERIDNILSTTRGL